MKGEKEPESGREGKKEGAREQVGGDNKTKTEEREKRKEEKQEMYEAR